MTKGAGEALRFQGQYAQADLEALADFTVSHLLDHRIARATAAGAVLAAIGALLLRSWPVAIGGFLAVLGASALARYVVLPRRLLRHVRASSGSAGARTITLDSRGIHHRCGGHEQTFSLKAVRRVALHPSHLFILLEPAGCLMLPLAWIQPPATIEDVAAFLVQRDDRTAP